MGSKFLKLFKILVGVILVGALTFLVVRAYDSQRGAPLEPWHTFIPHELKADELDRADWAKYIEAEKAIFDELRTHITQRLDAEDRVLANRYFEGSPVYPGRFTQDWNRSFVLEPAGTPVGVVVLLHGLTDSPYSQRHIGRRYQERGFLVIAPRVGVRRGPACPFGPKVSRRRPPSLSRAPCGSVPRRRPRGSRA